MPGGCAVSETGVVPDPAIKNTLRFEFIRGFVELCDAGGVRIINPQPPTPPACTRAPGINPQPPGSTRRPRTNPQPPKVSRATNSADLVCFGRVSRFGSYSYYNLITVAIPLNGELTYPSQRSFRG